jgi:oligopeptide/dipeptide ABC transporter ATP-binding protein
MTGALLQMRDVRVTFSRRRLLSRSSSKSVAAVDGVDLELAPGETLALVGESGSGKSTLGLAAIGLRPLSSGEIAWRGRPLSSLQGPQIRAFRREAQIIFQNPFASLNPRLPIGESLRRPAALHIAAPAGEISARVDRWLDLVGLRPARFRERFPHELSGGQRQRVAIARALLLEPAMVVADEPISALDVSLRAQILAIFRNLRDELAFSLLFLSHDLGAVRFIADRVAVMYLGKIMEQGPVEDIFQRPRHPYTKMLLSAAPTLRALATDETPPRAIAVRVGFDAPVDSGCRFRSRCPFAFERCTVESPLARAIEPGRMSACHLD